MKKINFLLLILFCFLLSGCSINKQNSVKHPVGPGGGFYLNSRNIYDDFIEIYTFDDGSKIYTNLKELLYEDYSNDISDIPLAEALRNGYTKIDALYENWEIIETYDDGGTKIYNNDEYYLLKCNTISGNKNIIIGTKKDVYYLCNN